LAIKLLNALLIAGAMSGLDSSLLPSNENNVQHPAGDASAKKQKNKEPKRALCCSMLTMIVSIPALIGA